MLGVSEGTAEEFHGWCQSSSAALRAAALAHAAAGRTVPAVADAWSSDISAMQAAIWGHLVIGSHSPQRVFFQTAEPISQAIFSNAPGASPSTTALDVIEQARAGALGAFTDDLASTVAASWSDMTFLRELPAPTVEEIRAWAAERLEGLSAERFMAARRELARQRMVDAQVHRMKGDTSGAVTAAYEADYRTLEAYLVESALACGDTALMSVCSRSDLVGAALAALPGLPDDFLRAAQVIRSQICQALGDADAERFSQCLLDLQRVD